jgi:ribosome-binding factor A
MSNHTDQKIEELIKNAAAEFLQRESSGNSLITVTGAVISDKLTKTTIYISVFPEDKQDAALDFAKRKRAEFKEYMKSHVRLRKIPFVDFEIDIGEKNRQRIDEISREIQ